MTILSEREENIMSEFKAFDGGEPFVQPERPFLLIYNDEEDGVNYSWLESEEDLIELVKEVKSYDCEIIDAIEIGRYREINTDEI